MTVSTNHAHGRWKALTPGNPLNLLTRGAVAALAAFSLLTGAAVAASASELGIDVASFQHPKGTSINWAAVKADGVSFAFIKATEGTSYTNPYFAGDWAATRSVGLFHGAYHFARPSVGSAAAQARYFVSKAGRADKAGDLPPVLDLEVTGGLGPKALCGWTATWLRTVESLTGRKPIIYTSPVFWETNMGNSTAFTAYPLWVAHYMVSAPRVPGGWSTWTFWQGRSTGRVTGVIGNVDMNAFNGTPAQLAAFARMGKVPQPTPDPGTTTRVGSTASLVLSRKNVYAGERVAFSGKLTGADGAPMAGRLAFLNRRPSGQTTWARVATLTTDATGHYAATLKLTSSASYKVIAPATNAYARAVSPIGSVAVTPKTVTRLTLAAGRPTVRRGAPVRLFGHLLTSTGSAVSGKQVKYFVRPAGSRRWARVGSATSLARTGWHHVYVRPRKTSTYKAVFVGGLRFTATTSKVVRVTVRR